MSGILSTGHSFEERATRPTPSRRLDVYLAADYEELSQLAAEHIIACLDRLGAGSSDMAVRVVVSAGRTPIRTYEILATDYISEFDWSRIELYQMDEYVYSDGGPLNFHSYLRERFVVPLGIGNAFLLDNIDPGASLSEWRRAIEEHESQLKAAGHIDLAFHGIGTNGHLGFNEPMSDLSSVGRVVTLSASTRENIAQQPAPTWGVTLGLGTLIGAKESILVAAGENKATAVARLLDGPVSSDCPASWLRTAKKTTVILDVSAAAAIGASQ